MPLVLEQQASGSTRALVPGKRVDVIGIGAHKAATTWIYRCLTEHPAVRGARSQSGSDKELDFFNYFYHRGYDWYHQAFEFGAWKNVEFSVAYFSDRNVPSRIHQYNRDAKLLLSLRNPIDRAYSHHKHEIARNRVGRELYNFWSALQQNPSYIERGRYASFLTQWLDNFDRGQLHIVEYEDILSNPADVLAGIFEFLEIDSSFRPRLLNRPINISHVKRNPALHRLVRRTTMGVRGLLGARLARSRATSSIRRRIHDLNRVKIESLGVPQLTADDRRRLAEIFADENAWLGQLLGRSFSHWT